MNCGLNTELQRDRPACNPTPSGRSRGQLYKQTQSDDGAYRAKRSQSAAGGSAMSSGRRGHPCRCRRPEFRETKPISRRRRVGRGANVRNKTPTTKVPKPDFDPCFWADIEDRFG